MARIVEPLPIAELEARYRTARAVTEARHYQAIGLLAQGRTFREVGEVLAFAPRWVEELAARYNALGPEALGDQRRRNGRAASLLRADVLAALAERLKGPPDDGGLWSGAKGGGLDGAVSQLGAGTSAARLGGAAADRVVPSGATAAACPGGDAGTAGGVEGGLEAAVAAAKAAHPDR
jgi:Helix-turn-helix domain